jgi:hypothetical protein
MKSNTTTDGLVFEHVVDAQIAAYLKEVDIRFEYDLERGLFTFGIKGENCQWRMHIQYDHERNSILVLSTYPIIASDANKIKVAELLTRLNEGFGLGCFQMNFESGEIMFRIGHIVQEGSLDEATFKRLFYINLNTTDQYFVPIFSVNAGLVEPVIAFHNCIGK